MRASKYWRLVLLGSGFDCFTEILKISFPVIESKPEEEKVEVRLIFGEKRQIETNEKTSLSVSGVGRKKLDRKRKPKKFEEEGSAVAVAAAGPGKRSALEEFKEKCGVGLSDEKISSMKLMTLIPREHNYFVHESAKLLKIKLTQAQVLFNYLP